MQTKHNYYTARINKVLDYIDEDIAKVFTLNELALHANFSKFHFHRIFIAVVGESPFQYVTRLRLEKAASVLLSQPIKSIADVSLQCGFSDAAIFSRNFKKYFGCSPSAYKKTNLQKSNNSQINSNNKQNNIPPTPYFCRESKIIKWNSSMEIIKNIEVKTLEAIPVAYNRSLGAYQGNTMLYQKHRNELFAWAASKGVMREMILLTLYYTTITRTWHLTVHNG